MQDLSSTVFWPEFISTYWERTPTTFPMGVRHTQLEPLAFEAVVAVADSLRAGASAPLRWLGQGGMVQIYPSSDQGGFTWLPTSGDLDFAHYWKRLSQSQHDLFLNVGNLQSYSPRLWFEAREFVRSLYREVGMPSDRAWCDIYVGRYPSTPFGVHVDHASNFMFGLSGTKTIYLWEPEFYEKHMRADSAGYERWIGDATRLELRPGHVAYWPSRLWHVARSDEFSVTMNYAFYLTRSSRTVVLPSILELVEESTRALEVIGPLPFEAGAAGPSVPASYRHACAAAVNALSPSGLAGRLEYDITRQWLGHRSALGFPKGLVPRACEQLRDDDVVIARKGEQILTAEIKHPITGEPRLLLAGQGNTADIDADARIADLVREVGTHAPCKVGDLVARFAGERVSDMDDVYELEPETIRALLTLFVTWYALDHYPPPTGA